MKDGERRSTSSSLPQRRCSAVLRAAIACGLAAAASLTHAQVYKCTDDDGKTAYSDVPCGPRSAPLKLQDGQRSVTDPNMCTQLLDETNRLRAEADRAAKRGRPESADNAKRRRTLDRQYAERCAGVKRSATK